MAPERQDIPPTAHPQPASVIAGPLFLQNYKNVAIRAAGSAFILLACIFALEVAGIGWHLQVFYALLATGALLFIEVILRPPDFVHVAPKPVSDPPWPLLLNELREHWDAQQRQLREEAERAHEHKEEAVRSRRIRDTGRFCLEIVLVPALAIITGFYGPRLQKTVPAGAVQSQRINFQDELYRYFSAHPFPQPTNTRQELTAYFKENPFPQSPDMQKALISYFDSHPFPQPPNMQNELTTYFGQHPNQSAASGAFSLTWPWLLLIVAALLVFWFISRKHKEAVPIAGAAGLAIEALKHSKELSKMGPDMYWWIVKAVVRTSVLLTLIFAVVAIVEIWKRARAAAKTEEPPASAPTVPLSLWEKFVKGWKELFGASDGKKEKSESKEDYLTSLGFSVFVLLWVALLVTYNTSPNPPDTGDKKHVQTDNVETNPLESLPALYPFAKSSSELVAHKDATTWTKDLGQRTKPGDTVILVGSADCIPFHKRLDSLNNTKLAVDRSEKAAAWLGGNPDLKGVRVISMTVDQHEHCSEGSRLRAVYPFRLQGKPQ